MASDHDNCQHDHHSHAHGHAHGHGVVANIRIAFFLNAGFSLIELIGGYWIGSLAIMADAVHDLGDSISLGGAWWLERFAKRAKDQSFNFGYQRFSLLSALLAGVVISAGSLIILYGSLQRLRDPVAPAGLPMMGLAVLGLIINGAAAYRLSRGKTQNEKLLTWHLIEDVMGWAVVLIGGFFIWLTGASWIDPLLAIGLAVFVLFNVFRHLKDTTYLFLQGRPQNFNERAFLVDALAVPGVEKIDHLAVWSLDGESSILSARLHIHQVRDPLEIERVKSGVREIAAKQRATATLETCLAEHAPHESGD